MAVEVIPFFILAAIAVLAALAMITSRNAVHAALFLMINCGALAALYLVLNAPVLAMVQVAVYGGAIIVLFLVVIMLLGAERLGGKSKLEWQRPLAIWLALALTIEGGYLFFKQLRSGTELSAALADSSPQAVGEVLFDRYLFSFEITAVLLLVALVAAILLTLDQEQQE